MCLLYFSASLQTFQSLIYSLLGNFVYDAPTLSVPASGLSIIDIHQPLPIGLQIHNFTSCHAVTL